jgi:hypothetical protein
MNELRGFLRWQWRQILSANWTSWMYIIGLALFVGGIVFGSSILAATGGAVIMAYLLHIVVSWQLDKYRSERTKLLQELERKQ